MSEKKPFFPQSPEEKLNTLLAASDDLQREIMEMHAEIQQARSEKHKLHWEMVEVAVKENLHHLLGVKRGTLRKHLKHWG